MVGMTGTATTLMFRTLVAIAAPAGFEAEIVTGVLATAVGIPEIRPVDAFRVRPVGKVVVE